MNAAHAINKPDSPERVIPSGSFAGLRVVFMLCDFFIITVQTLAPIRRKKLPKTAKVEETKNVMLFFNIPLPKPKVRVKMDE